MKFYSYNVRMILRLQKLIFANYFPSESCQCGEESYHFVHFRVVCKREVVISRISKEKRLAPDNEHSVLTVEAAYGRLVMCIQRGLWFLDVYFVKDLFYVDYV